MNDEKSLSHEKKFKGNLLLFYSFDVGDEIGLDELKQKGLLSIRSVSLSSFFKNYHIPLSFDIEGLDGQESLHADISGHGSVCISSKVHHFGVLSFCYKIPFDNSFDELKEKVITLKEVFDKKCNVDAKNVFKKIFPTIKKPKFYNLSNFYFAVQVDPGIDKINPEEFKLFYGGKIASVLRLETLKLSAYQEKEVLSATTGYSGQDMIIIDTEAAFIYDDEYFESLEFFEFANIQQLELQYFDRLLDEKLNVFYSQEAYRIPWFAYIPFLGERLNLPIFNLAKLRVDISVITERLENSIKMAGEAYFSKLYSILRSKLGIYDWRASISRKLDIVKDLYSVYQARLDIIHEEILTLVIILLIALEAILAFIH